MSEWFPLLAIFWGLYFLDGLRFGRRERLHLHAGRGVRRARVTTAAWHLPLPLPSAWSLTVDDLPVSLSPEGLSNWPAGSASRPPPLPGRVERYAWEDITEIRRRSGWIHLNGRRFCPETTGLTANDLRELAARLAPLDAAARASALADWERTRWTVTRLARRLRVALGRSRFLVALNTLQTALLLAATVYLLGDGPARVSPQLGDRIARALPWWAGYYGLLHLVAINEFRRLHRRLFPSAGEERGNLIVTALLVPAQALRLRLHLLRRIAGPAHPLAAALAAGPDTAAAGLAANALRDLDWPFLPVEKLPPGTDRIVLAANARIRVEATAALVATDSARLQPEAFQTPPRPHSPEVCAYCPRCHDQFIRADARCHLGVPLKPLPPDTGYASGRHASRSADGARPQKRR